MAALILDEKWSVLFDKNNFWTMKNPAGDHPGLEMPSTSHRAPLQKKIIHNVKQIKYEKYENSD